jgi:hypothetical protein
VKKICDWEEAGLVYKGEKKECRTRLLVRKKKERKKTGVARERL